MIESKKKITVKDIVLIGMMIAVLEVSKLMLNIIPIPNVELVTFWIIMFTLFFRNKMIFVIPVFVLIEGVLFGFGIWWVMYLYMWPFLALIAWIFSKKDSAIIWAIISGLYGLSYGFFCSIPYFVIGAADGGLMGGISSAITWWITGIPYDIIHGVANFIIMIVLYRPIKSVMDKVCRMM